MYIMIMNVLTGYQLVKMVLKLLYILVGDSIYNSTLRV